MEPYQWVTLGITASGFLVNGILLIVAVTWQLSKSESRVWNEIAITNAKLERYADSAAEHVRREIGETIQAMQTKIHEFEKWSRDSFVRRDSFVLVTKDIREGMQAQSASADSRLKDIDAKLDRLIERLIPKL